MVVHQLNIRQVIVKDDLKNGLFKNSKNIEILYKSKIYKHFIGTITFIFVSNFVIHNKLLTAKKRSINVIILILEYRKLFLDSPYN